MTATFTVGHDLEALVRIGGIAAIAAAVLTLIWLVVMVTTTSAPAGSTDLEELRSIADHDADQIARFLPTTLVAIAYVPTWLGLGALLWAEAPALAALGVAFGVLYPAFTATGYWMQYTVVRGLARLAKLDEPTARAGYEVVGFHDRPTSMSYSAVVLGYVFWSLAGVAVGIGLLSHGGGLATTTGSLFLVTAALMFTGAAGHVARSRILATGVLLSGVTSLGATVATAVLLMTQA